jgi:hypothetical protein
MSPYFKLALWALAVVAAFVAGFCVTLEQIYSAMVP